MANKKYYYVSSNTSKGYVNFLTTNVTDIQTIIVLKHESNMLKTQVLRGVINELSSINNLEIICSPFGTSFIEGIVIREKSLAVITDTIADKAIKGGIEIDLANYLPGEIDQEDITKTKQLAKQLKQKAYDVFAIGLEIHDHLEDIYIGEMNFSKADQLSEKFIEDLLKDVPYKSSPPVVYQRFFGTNTAEGAVNILPIITEHLSRRVHVKGRAGTGKSVFMKKVAKACEDHGLDVERYHCSFDPGSIDMILVPALDFCIFDSTAPHEYFPTREGDQVIDLYEQTVTPGTDEKYAREIGELTDSYKQYLQKGMDYLKQATECYEGQFDKPYVALDKAVVYEIVKIVCKQMI